MKCEDVSNNLISYLDRRTNSADRVEMEDHLGTCAECRTRAEEFRKVWTLMEELPALEPSLGFDAHVRERVAAEPRRGWFGLPIPRFVPGFMLQPRLAFSAALLIALCLWTARLPHQAPAIPQATSQTTAQSDMEQFQEINDLGVLENYDVVTKMDALSELAPVSERSETRSTHEHAHDNGGA